MNPLVWTKKKPTKSGWYWRHRIGTPWAPEMIELKFYCEKGMQILGSYMGDGVWKSVQGLTDNSNTWMGHIVWCGPLQPPPLEPKKERRK